MDNILKIDYNFLFKKTVDFVYLYFNYKDVLAKDIKLPIQNKGVRHVGGGDYVYKVIYSSNDFDKYNHYRFNSKHIELQIESDIENKIFESETIIIGVVDNNIKSNFKNCKFICNRLILSAKMDYATFINCDFNEVKMISI